MEHAELNLTRKWRSKNFQEVIGQPLAVRILQNSLYLKQFFPVYLFAGQRGCGKTSSARIFAAAVNCARLPEFQADPKKIALPCQQCESCIAMSKSQHPDFIEIDAASHTGVDNVRNIIDASSFLPLLSHKKIYLIDEAHMLSKAAFNAFLKILEEPPMSVIFILATTDMHKILDTVKSRCFQIFFDPVNHQVIQEHIKKICIAEKILFDEQGLDVIARQADGSVRDAINLLEQVRFATKKISKEAVLSILGHIDESTLLQLFEKIIIADVCELLLFCGSLEKYAISIEYVWGQLIELVYDAILIQYRVQPRQFSNLPSSMIDLIQRADLQKLRSLFEMLCLQEQNLAKTTKKLRFLEMMLLQHISDEGFAQQAKKKNSGMISSGGLDDNPVSGTIVTAQDKWQQFIGATKGLQDLILVTMFQDAQFIAIDEKNEMIQVSFLKKFIMFKDLIEQERKNWHAILQNIFGHQAQLQFSFEHVSEHIKVASVQNHTMRNVTDAQPLQRSVGNKLDISDANRWKLAHELMKHFDGIITEISGDVYE